MLRREVWAMNRTSFAPNRSRKMQQTRSRSNESTANLTNLIDIPSLVTIWLQVLPELSSTTCQTRSSTLEPSHQESLTSLPAAMLRRVHNLRSLSNVIATKFTLRQRCRSAVVTLDRSDLTESFGGIAVHCADSYEKMTQRGPAAHVCLRELAAEVACIGTWSRRPSIVLV
jgi:hypothetical protein